MLAIVGNMENSHEKALLGRRLRTLREIKGWTQQELGDRSDVNYKYLGEIERGKQNPSFNILLKIAASLGVELMEFFRLEPEISDRQEIESRIIEVVKFLPDDELHRVLLLLRAFYPLHSE